MNIYTTPSVALSNVATALNGNGFGPLTGQVPPGQRQELIDRFSSAGPGAVTGPHSSVHLL